MIKYSVLRLALFVASLGALWLVGVRRSLLMLVLAAMMSLALSYVLLARQRDDFARAIADRIDHRLERTGGLGSDTASEDAAVDAAQAPPAAPVVPSTRPSEADPQGE